MHDVKARGNNIINDPKLHVLFWYGDTEAGVIRDLGQEVMDFLTALCDSNYFNRLNQYGGVNQPVLDRQWRSRFFPLSGITNVKDDSLPDDQIQTILQALVRDNNIPHPNPRLPDTASDLYIVFVGARIEVTHDGESSIHPTETGGFLGVGKTSHDRFGGYHHSTKTLDADGDDDNLFYAVIPWASDSSQNLYALPAVRNDAAFQSLARVWGQYASHEIVEACTSRDGNGYQVDGKEIGDVCEPKRIKDFGGASTRNVTGARGQSWRVETYWSQSDGTCVPTSDIVVPPATAFSQNLWVECDKCGVLFYNGGIRHGKSVCPVGLQTNPGHPAHSTPVDGNGFILVPIEADNTVTNVKERKNTFVLRGDDPAASGQPGWRWCNRCEGLFFSRNSCRCPAGDFEHDDYGSADYTLPGTPAGNWRYCSKCGGLFNALSKNLVCSDGQAHDASRSGNYSLANEGIVDIGNPPVTVTSHGPVEGTGGDGDHSHTHQHGGPFSMQ